MAVNKDAIGILFGVAGGGAVNSESYNEINRGLNEIVNNINSKDPKFIKLHIDDAEFDKEVEKVKEKVKDIAIGTNIKVASGEAASSLKQIETAAKAATETVKQEAKAQQDATQKINKKKVAYEAATKALKDYQKALESAASRKGSKQIRIDENGIAYTDSKKMAGAVEKLNAAYRKAQEAMSESALNEMGKRNAAALIKTNTALEAELAELMTNFRKTTSEKEAQRAAEIEAANKQQADRLNASQAALDAMQRYHDVLREVVEAESVSFNGKEFLPTNETEQAIQYAERLNVALRESNEAMQSPNLTEGGKKGVMSSYGDEVEALLKRLDPVIQKEKQEAEAVDEATQKRNTANQTLLETLSAMRQLLALKEELDTVTFDGFFQAAEIGGKEFIDDTHELTVHEQDLLDAIDRVNESFGRFQTAARQSGVDVSKFADSKQFKEMNTLIKDITSDISEASKKAREMYDILYKQDFGVATALDQKGVDGKFVKEHHDNRGLVGYFYSQIKGAKGNQDALSGVFEEVRKQATNIARTSGEEWADEFFHAVQSKTHVNIPYWKQTLSEATSAGGNEGSGTTERLDNVAETINDIAAKVPEILALAESQGQDVSGVVDAIAEKVQEAKRETEELVNAEKEVKQETQEAAVAEEKKVRKKKESKKVAEETTSAVTEEVKKNEEAVKTEEKKLEKKTRSKKAAKEAAGAVAEETKKIEEATAAEEKKTEKKVRGKKATEEEKQAQSEATEETKRAADADEKDNQIKQKKQKTTKKLTEEQRKAIQIMREYFQVALEVESAMTRTNEIGGSKEGGFMYEPSDKKQDHYSSLIAKFEAIKQKYDGLSQSQEQYLRNEKLIDQEEMKLSTTMQARQLSAQTRWNKLRDKAQQYYQDMQGVATRSEEASERLDEINRIANKDDWRNYDLLNQKLEETKGFIDRNNLATEKWYQKMLKTFGTRVRSLLAGLILGKVTQYLRDIYTNVVEIDSALTQLRIVTGASERQMEKFLSNSTRLAKELGASIKDVIASVETFSRLGYGLTDATTLSQYATILSKVADVSSEEATKGLTSILKGYGFDPSDSEHIADVLVEVGQKYAVSASELMTAYEKAGAALNATNTSFEKSAGLIAAANASVQDASVVGTALKTVSARIRKSKADLDDLGESAEDLAESWSIYAEEIKSLTGFDIMAEGSKTKFKDLYDIFNGLAQVWNDLGENAETTQARVAEILGGARQYQVISSILANWEDAAGAYTDALNSAGTSMEAMSIYTDSVQGRIEQLKATFEELSADLLDSSLVKGVTTIVTGVLTLLDDIVKLIDLIGGLNTVLGITAGLVAVIKAETIVTFIHGAISAIGSFIVSAKAAIVQMFTMVKASKAAQASMTGLATSEQLAAVKTAELRMAMLKLVAVVAVITVVIQALKALDNAWQDSYQSHLDAAEKYNEEADEYAEEIDSLVSLQKQLQDARGDKTKLAKIYDELNEKISVSTTLIDGEAGAYLAANQQLQDRIEYLQQMEDQARKTAIAEQRSAFNENKMKRYGDILGEWFGLTSSSVFMWDWAASDAEGSQLREMMRGKYDLASWNGHTIDYDYWTNEMTEDQQDIWLRQQGMTREDWDAYWQDQVKTALSVFSGVINTYDGYLGADFITNVVKTLVMHGYDLDEIDGAVRDLEAADGEVESLIDDYYTSLANKDARSSEYYNKIVAKLDEIKQKYPELADQVKNFIGSISKSITVSDDSDVLKLKSVYAILCEISGEYDALTDAMEDMEEYGVLTAKTFESMIKDYPNLIQYLKQTENGYLLNADALEAYTTALIDTYTAEAALATMTAENKKIALLNLKNLQTALAMLSVSSAKVKSDSSARKKALGDEKDALKDQLDAYKQLIDLRKELLQQYEDELKYKRELEKKERKVASLQTQLAVSQLDNTAAGRAKTRQLAKDLKEAQEDLDDYTLEHAIDVVTNELDNQYAEYKKFIDGKLDGIEDAIEALSESNSGSASGVSMQIATAAAAAADKIAAAIEKIETTPVVNVNVTGGGTTTSSRWTSYQDAANAGFSNIRTAHEFARGGDDKEKYGTYQAYLDAMYEKYVGSSAYGQALAAAQTYISTHGMLEGDKARWGQDPNFLPLLRALINAGGSINDLHGKTNTVKGNTSVYHSGGIVGEFTRLKSTEQFAKLLKGEFVATPAMMERFMNQTLPNLAASGGGNEFNAPLVSIQCENVTQESLPKLKQIVNDAVKEIKRQFDDGLTRAGYHKTVNKIV